MEIRGVGIIDVRSMFGVRAIRFQKRLEVLIELEVWDDKGEYTRTGLDDTNMLLHCSLFSNKAAIVFPEELVDAVRHP